MRTLGLFAFTAVAVGVVAFHIAAPKAEDRKSSWSPLTFTRGDCDGRSAAVNGSEARLAWDGSARIIIAVPSKIRWRRDEGTEVVLRGNESDLERIRLEDGTLKVCGGFEKDAEIEIVLPGVMFEKVTIAGAGELTMDGVDQSALDLTIAGAGRLEANGRSDDLKLTIAGAGEARLGELAAKRLKLTIAGAGDAEAAPTDNADVTIVGAGDVKLLTRPARHDFDVIGTGEIDMPGKA